jgi:rhomboid family GlyGly-CTERM serine protease
MAGPILVPPQQRGVVMNQQVLSKSYNPARMINLASIDMRFLISLLILVNLGLLFGNVPTDKLAFDYFAISNGQWWRLFSWPLVHVSRYHLLLDGVAFLLLYQGLEEQHLSRRFMLVICAATGSLLLPLAMSSYIYSIGLCGLSGVAHGLAAVSSLEMIQHDRQRSFGVVLLVGLLIKVTCEIMTGNIIFQSLHFGSVGQPIVSTHAGGVIGGVLGYLIVKKLTSRRESTVAK